MWRSFLSGFLEGASLKGELKRTAKVFGIGALVMVVLTLPGYYKAVKEWRPVEDYKRVPHGIHIVEARMEPDGFVQVLLLEKDGYGRYARWTRETLVKVVLRERDQWSDAQLNSITQEEIDAMLARSFVEEPSGR